MTIRDLRSKQVLVTGAGSGIGRATALAFAAAGANRVLDINVMGVVHGCHFFLPRMIAAGGARQVVNVSSLAGIAPVPNMSAYAASKSAVLGLCDVLAMELAGSGIGVTAVCPGIINTPITSSRRSPSVSDAQIAGLQTFYRTKGCEADVVAAGIVRAVNAGREMLLVGPFAQSMYHVKRMSRALARKLSLDNAKKIGFWPTAKA